MLTAPNLSLQPWPELLGRKGNNPYKMTYFPPPPPPPPMQNQCQAFKTFSVDSTLLGGGGTKEMVY